MTGVDSVDGTPSLQKIDKHKLHRKRKQRTSTDAGVGASLSKLIDATQSHFSKNDNDRMGSITESLPIVHAENVLSRGKEEREDRNITRQMVTKDLNKWNYFVKKLNTAEHVEFPLRSTMQDTRLHTMTSLTSPAVPETCLEKKLSEIYTRTGLYDTGSHLGGSCDDGFMPFKKLSQSDSSKEYQLEQPDGVETSSILAKLKAVMSYDVRKRQRANKIKSKQYHRMRRREETKAQEAMTKKMHDIDPKAAMLHRKRVLEKQRALERASLRHKNTSKFVKHIKRAAIWDKEKREALGQRDEIHRQKTQKHLSTCGSEVSSEDEFTPSTDGQDTTAQAIFSQNRLGLRKMAFMQRERPKDPASDIEKPSDSESDDEPENDESCVHAPHTQSVTKKSGMVFAESRLKVPVVVQIPQIANEFDQCEEKSFGKPVLESSIENPRTEQENLIREAFAEDDILQELIKEKESAVEKEASPIDSTECLPGWREWGGLSTDGSLNRTQRTRQARLEAKRKVELDVLRQRRKDLSLAHVYINEEADAAIPPEFVSRKVPYPFESQAQYEESIRRPLGKEW
eukprot:CAMPEP_0201517470 /NCGR_PEP_ID=MMETSP0161_2-20130828/8566_1 /ASSEMBLY_ACC=CAM_ASM_000251 /TAXON_ID=180227 /ORGANISM="Neoparamoeba aestuarina, Strain SoJaBio B1-5/56/2" /LENGTH=569 /DNA_ID=CAMNT_0047914975 /DNA_START=686 /DNA_END=2392 /DNA_ORIENTATION=-